MKPKKTVYLLVFLLALQACRKKDLPQDVINSPEFYAHMQVDGSDVKLEAGNNDYFMFASHDYDSSVSVNMFKADLRQNSSASYYSLTILLNDNDTVRTAGTGMKAESLMPGQRNYNDLSALPQQYNAKFTPVKGFEASGIYNWILAEGANAMPFNGYSISTNLSAGKSYTVSLSYNDAGGSCPLTYSNVFVPGAPISAVVKSKQDYSGGSVFQSTLSANVNGKGPYTYEWDFGDGTPKSNVSNPIHSYDNTLGQSMPFDAVLKVSDARNNTCFYNYEVPVKSDNPCLANFIPEVTPVFNPKVLSSVTVLLTDPSGITYTSKDLFQTTGSQFEIISVEDYQPNSLNESTKKIKVKFNCTVTNGSKSMAISNAEAVIAVSYK